MKTQFRNTAIAAALCALFAIQAEARTLYVDASRPNNKGNGLKLKTAKKTIQAAINIAKKGDTILVYPGTYAPIKTNNKKITIKAAQGAAKTKIVKPDKPDQQIALAELGKEYSTVISTVYTLSGTFIEYNYTRIFSKGSKSTIEGFLLDGKNRSVGLEGLLVGISGGRAKSCTIQRIGSKNDAADGDSLSFEMCFPVANAKLMDCTLKNNRSQAFCPEYSIYGGSATIFQRCKIRNNDSDIGFGDKASLYNCLVTGNTAINRLFFDNTLINCTVAKNTVYLDSLSLGYIAYETKYYNCILWKNYTVESKNVKMAYVEHYGHFANTLMNTDWTNKDPKFVNATKGNYKLKKESYAINKGKLTAKQKKLVGSKDLAGKKRIRGKAIDRGCYEY